MFRKLSVLLTRAEKLQALGLLALFLLMAGTEALGVASILPFISILSDPGTVQTNRWLRAGYEFFGFENVNHYLFAIGLMVLAVLVVTNLVKALTRWATLYISQLWGEEISCRLFRIYLNQSYSFFLNRNSADLSKNILAEVHTLTNSVLMSSLDMITKIIVSLAILLVLMAMDPVLAVAVIVILGGSYGFIFFIFKQPLNKQGQIRALSQKEKFQIVNEAMQGIKNIKLGGYEEIYARYFSGPAQRYSKSTAKSNVIAEIPKYAMEVLAFGGILLITLYLLLEGQQSVSQALPVIGLYAFAGYRLMPSVQAVYAGFTRIRFHKAAIDIILQELALAGAMQRADHDAPALPFHRALALHQVSFRYAGADRDVLSRINYEIPAGKTIGIVGKTGSGKTTFVDLVLGLLTPTAGEIAIDGVPLHQGNLKAWQKNLSYVSQHIYLCDDTIAANIAFGVPGDEVDTEQVRRAAGLANIAGFIEGDLPHGYQTLIGENGVRLSGGQRQRIGIARALYLERPVLVFDEATNALDPETEKDVIDSLYALKDNKTILIISHKPELLTRCDEIIMIRDGAVLQMDFEK